LHGGTNIMEFHCLGHVRIPFVALLKTLHVHNLSCTYNLSCTGLYCPQDRGLRTRAKRTTGKQGLRRCLQTGWGSRDLPDGALMTSESNHPLGAPEKRRDVCEVGTRGCACCECGGGAGPGVRGHCERGCRGHRGSRRRDGGAGDWRKEEVLPQWGVWREAGACVAAGCVWGVMVGPRVRRQRPSQKRAVARPRPWRRRPRRPPRHRCDYTWLQSEGPRNW
jgi:hypothetical protein